jgi:hypothetical protein
MGCSFAKDICAAQEQGVSLNLVSLSSLFPWLADADRCYQLADGNGLDLRSDGRARAGFV